MDAIERLAFEATEEVVAVVGCGEEYLLVDLTKGIPQELLNDETKRRTYLFAGVIGMVDGRAVAKCNPNLTAEASIEAGALMLLATAEFARRVAERIKREQGGDFAQFVSKLMDSPDAREK